MLRPRRKTSPKAAAHGVAKYQFRRETVPIQQGKPPGIQCGLPCLSNAHYRGIIDSGDLAPLIVSYFKRIGIGAAEAACLFADGCVVLYSCHVDQSGAWQAPHVPGLKTPFMCVVGSTVLF
jgi:hypothetical protein